MNITENKTGPTIDNIWYAINNSSADGDMVARITKLEDKT
jgi:hypothetical protein